MEKTLYIQNKEIKLKSSLFTIIAYKSTFGSELFSDISELDKLGKAKTIASLSSVIDVIFKITYILHKPYTTKGYEDFLQDFDFSFLSNPDELASLANTIAELLGTTVKDSNSEKK